MSVKVSTVAVVIAVKLVTTVLGTERVEPSVALERIVVGNVNVPTEYPVLLSFSLLSVQGLELAVEAGGVGCAGDETKEVVSVILAGEDGGRMGEGGKPIPTPVEVGAEAEEVLVIGDTETVLVIVIMVFVVKLSEHSAFPMQREVSGKLVEAVSGIGGSSGVEDSVICVKSGGSEAVKGGLCGDEEADEIGGWGTSGGEVSGAEVHEMQGVSEDDVSQGKVEVEVGGTKSCPRLAR